MSIILKALKKIQEQEAGQRAGQPTAPSSDASLSSAKPTISTPPSGVPKDERMGGRAAISPADMGVDRPEAYVVGTPPSVARPTFGPGPKALLGLLVFVGIAMVGWFGASLYNVNSGRSSDTAAPQTPVVVKVPAPSPALESAASVSTPTPIEPVAEPVVEPVLRAVEQTEAAAVIPAAPAIFVRPPAPPELAAPVVKEAVPEKKGRPEFKINAIAWKNKEPRAIVNMQSIYEGDIIEGATVVAIKRKIVIFEYEGETFQVRFGI